MSDNAKPCELMHSIEMKTRYDADGVLYEIELSDKTSRLKIPHPFCDYVAMFILGQQSPPVQSDIPCLSKSSENDRQEALSIKSESHGDAVSSATMIAAYKNYQARPVDPNAMATVRQSQEDAFYAGWVEGYAADQRTDLIKKLRAQRDEAVNQLIELKKTDMTGDDGRMWDKRPAPVSAEDVRYAIDKLPPWALKDWPYLNVIIRAAEQRVAPQTGVLVEALQYIDKACLCTRYTKGFDYGDKHKTLGVAGVGERWVTPRDKIFHALTAHSKGV